jgi:hypothetical protein
VNPLIGAVGRAIGFTAGWGLDRLTPSLPPKSVVVEGVEGWERHPDSFRPKQGGEPFTPRPRPSGCLSRCKSPSPTGEFFCRLTEGHPGDHKADLLVGCFKWPNTPSSSAAVEPSASVIPVAEESPTPADPPNPPAGVGQPTAEELRCAAFAVREWGATCATEFGSQYWGALADKLNEAAEK